MDNIPDKNPTDESAYILEDQVGYLLRLAGQRHVAIFQKNTMRNLTPTQFSTLVRIDLVGECSQNKLGRMISMDVATIKGVVDRLKKKNLVNLKPDPNDRRRTIISLTDEAMALVADLHKMGAYITDATLEPLTGKEKKTLLRLLKKIT